MESRAFHRSSSVSCWLAASLAAASCVVVVACTRAPEEPPARPASAESAAALSTAAGANAAPVEAKRCIRATRETPPPPVAPGPAPGCPRDPEGGPPMVPIVQVTFPDAKDARIEAELVRPPQQTERGLMYRKSMAENHGMLFNLGDRRDHNFWMRNTCIPLDMLFVEDDGLIVGIEENVPTLNDENRGVGCPSSWVLETNAGWARKNGVRAGQKMTIPASAR